MSGKFTSNNIKEMSSPFFMYSKAPFPSFPSDSKPDPEAGRTASWKDLADCHRGNNTRDKIDNP